MNGKDRKYLLEKIARVINIYVNLQKTYKSRIVY